MKFISNLISSLYPIKKELNKGNFIKRGVEVLFLKWKLFVPR